MKGSEGAAKGQDNQEHEECRAAWAAWPGRDAGMEWTTTNSTLLTGQWLTGVKKRAKIKNVRIAKQEGIWIVMNRHTKRGWEQSNEPLWNENSARSGDDHPACQSWGRRKNLGEIQPNMRLWSIAQITILYQHTQSRLMRIWCRQSLMPDCQVSRQMELSAALLAGTRKQLAGYWHGIPGRSWIFISSISMYIKMYIYIYIYIYICVCVCEHDWAESHG